LQNEDYHIWLRGEELRDNKEGVARRHTSAKKIKLMWFEKGIAQTSALWLVPVIFIVAFLVLLSVSIVFTPLL
jgi:hypothetical protein